MTAFAQLQNFAVYFFIGFAIGIAASYAVDGFKWWSRRRMLRSRRANLPDPFKN